MFDSASHHMVGLERRERHQGKHVIVSVAREGKAGLVGSIDMLGRTSPCSCCVSSW
jgi:hypothetical protein